ncbi:MAG: hypothetical protein CMM15_14580 [Rhodospirillaceae bacterium]|nr:hypothetical protein [Rhodospirillaceae bacterium]
MADVSQAMQAKSDQLNAVDIMGCEPIITIRDVVVRQGDQPVSVYFNGDNNRPFKPSKGMIRILAAAWGNESQNWIGKSAQIYMDPEVTWAGEKVGGIRIRALSDINKNGMSFMLTLNKKKRIPYPVSYLSMELPPYPEDKFNKGFDTMVGWLNEGKSLEQIVAQCQKTGQLTEAQYQRLQEAAPVLADGDAE